MERVNILRKLHLISLAAFITITYYLLLIYLQLTRVVSSCVMQFLVQNRFYHFLRTLEKDQIRRRTSNFYYGILRSYNRRTMKWRRRYATQWFVCFVVSLGCYSFLPVTVCRLTFDKKSVCGFEGSFLNLEDRVYILK